MEGGGGQVGVGGVLVASVLMALTGGLGGIPFFFLQKLSPQVIGLCNAIAVGVMCACSFDLLREAEPHSSLLAATGAIAGALFVKAQQRCFGSPEDAIAQRSKRTLLLCTMAAHALGEGAGVGASFRGPSGPLVTLAMALHNVPEGLAVAAVLFAQGDSPLNCTVWAVLTSLPQACAAVPSYAFVGLSHLLLPPAMGFAGGCMLQMTFSEVLPDALDAMDKELASFIAVSSAISLELLRCGLHSLSTFHPTSQISIRGIVQTLKAITAATLPTNAIPATATGVLHLLKRLRASRKRIKTLLMSAAFAHLLATAFAAALFAPYTSISTAGVPDGAGVPEPGQQLQQVPLQKTVPQFDTHISDQNIGTNDGASGSSFNHEGASVPQQSAFQWSGPSAAASAGSAAAGAIAHALAQSAFGSYAAEHDSGLAAPMPTVASAERAPSMPPGIGSDTSTAAKQLSDMEEGVGARVLVSTPPNDSGNIVTAATATAAAAAAAAAYACLSRGATYQHAAVIGAFAFVDGAENAALALSGFTMRTWGNALIRAIPKGLALATSALLSTSSDRTPAVAEAAQHAPPALMTQSSIQKASRKAFLLASIVSAAEQAGSISVALGVVSACPVRLRQLAGGAAASLALRTLFSRKGRSKAGMLLGAGVAALPLFFTGASCESIASRAADAASARTKQGIAPASSA